MIRRCVSHAFRDIIHVYSCIMQVGDAETWMDANKAVELGFADEIMQRSTESDGVPAPTVSMLYSKANVVNSLMEKIAAKCAIDPKPTVPEHTGRSVDELRAKLNTIKNYI